MIEHLFSEEIVRYHLELKCNDIGLRRFCRMNGLDHGNVSNVIAGKKPMGKSIAEKIGYKAVTKYVKL